MRAKFVFEYDRGDDPKKGLRIGRYAPGTVKDFEDVRIGDIAKDYNGDEWEVVDKATLKIDLQNPPVNEFFPGISDPKMEQFLLQYDKASVTTGFLQNRVTDDMDGEEQELIACVSPEYHVSVVWLYDDSGALVYW